MPAARMQIVRALLGHANKESICFNGKHDVDLRRTAQTVRQDARHGVGAPRVPEPNVIVQETEPLCRQKSRLGCELASLLQAIIEFARIFLFEKNNEFASGRAVLCPTKAKNIHADLPRNFFGRATE